MLQQNIFEIWGETFHFGERNESRSPYKNGDTLPD